MSTVSDKQLAANQQNALKGGPKTPEGKAVVSKNAIKHGIFAKDIVVNIGLVQESSEEFEKLLESFFDAFNAKTDAEKKIVETVVFNVWRQRRLMLAETGEIKRANAYLGDYEDARQRQVDEINALMKPLRDREDALHDDLNSTTETTKLVEILDSVCAEYDANGILPYELGQSLRRQFPDDTSFCVILNFATKEVKDHERAAVKVALQKKLDSLNERLEYLERKQYNQKLHTSEANFVPDAKATERLLKYGASIDKQIRNALLLLRAVRGDISEEKEDLTPNT